MELGSNITWSHYSLQKRIFVVFFRCHSCDIFLRSKIAQWLCLHCTLLLCIGFLHCTTTLKWHNLFHWHWNFCCTYTLYECKLTSASDVFSVLPKPVRCPNPIEFQCNLQTEVSQSILRSLAWDKINDQGMIIQINMCTHGYWLQIINGINTKICLHT